MSTAAMSSAITFKSSSKDFSKFNLNIPIQSFHFHPSFSLSIKTTGSFRHSSSLKHNTDRGHSTISLEFLDDGDGNNNSGGGGDGDGSKW
ncbi:hypothetical protein Hanom_Chr02g00158741 [Helianthus anomalus]